MKRQIDTTDIFADPDPNVEYNCHKWSPSSTGFTKLMKWVLLTKQYPDLLSNIKNLIEADPSLLNRQNTRGWTALILSSVNHVEYSSIECITLLLKLGADPNIKRERGFTALQSLVNYYTEDDTEVIKLLIKAKTDLTIIDDEGHTVQHLAYATSNKELVKLLIELGADVDLKNKDGASVLDLAKKSQSDLVPFLESKSEIYSEPDPYYYYECSPILKSRGFTKLMKWTMLTHDYPELLTEIEILIKTDPDILNKRTDNGWTALILAARNSSTFSSESTVKLLLDAGANLSIQTITGETALTKACKYCYDGSSENTVIMLIDAGATCSFIDYKKSVKKLLENENISVKFMNHVMSVVEGKNVRHTDTQIIVTIAGIETTISKETGLPSIRKVNIC